jgi:nucleoside-diphosphate kinase
LQRVLDAGFRVRAMKLIHLTKPEAEGFYEVHRERPFFGELTTFMSSGPCVVLALEKEGAVKAWRDLMGATDPAKADEGTLRKEFANSIGENAVHGSDSEENAQIELAYFFSRLEFV